MRPTFNKDFPILEALIFDFDKDIYTGTVVLHEK